MFSIVYYFTIGIKQLSAKKAFEYLIM